ncbi:hypothetical protein IQ255_00545 [Pleurocapsales cyanobacterium LEGE 10410]|nr:hypothetical protein [Pleurocapsales cyanobacterium LEGE 10410]
MKVNNFFEPLSIYLGWQIALISLASLPATAQTKDLTESDRLDIPERVIEESPTLQRWLKEVPDVLEDIRQDPSFRTRLRLGFTTFPSNGDAAGINVGIEDIFIERTGLTISTDYQTAFNGDRLAVGADLHYFLLPLGNYVNFAPLVGYRYFQSNDFNTDGLHLGLRLMLAFSRTGAGDISLSQSFVSPGGNEEVGITSLSVGYAVTSKLRLSTDLEWQNSIEDNDNRAGINLELLL